MLRVRKKVAMATRKSVVSSWKESGLTQPSFCERDGLKLSTFKTWLRDLRRAGEFAAGRKGRRKTSLASSNFMPVKIIGSEAEFPQSLGVKATLESVYCEIRFGNGGRIIIEREESLEELRKMASVFVPR